MQRVIALSCLISLAIQPAIAQSRKEAVSLAVPGAIRNAPLPVSRKTPTLSKKARQDLSRSTYPSTHYQRGMYYRQKGELNSALIEFLKATQENPRLVKAFYEQALIFQQRGYLKLAESSLEQALAVDSRYQQARVLLATVRIEQGDISGAVFELSRSLGLPEKKPETEPQSGQLPDGVGQSEKAGPEAERAGTPPTLLQMLHNVLPEPAQPLDDIVAPPPDAIGSPAPVTDSAQTAPAEQASSPEQPVAPERKTGFAAVPSLPSAERPAKPASDLDDILKGIPGIDPDATQAQSPRRGAGSTTYDAAVPAAGDALAGGIGALTEAKKKFWRLPNILKAPAAPCPQPSGKGSADGTIRISRSNLRQPPSPKADKLGQKAKKLKRKADKLRRRADKLGLSSDLSQNEQEEESQPGVKHGRKDRLASTSAAAQHLSTKVREREQRQKNRDKKKGLFAGIFAFFEQQSPDAVSDKTAQPEARTAGGKAKRTEVKDDSEQIAMVVRQPLLAPAEPIPPAAEPQRPSQSPRKLERKALIAPAPTGRPKPFQSPVMPSSQLRWLAPPQSAQGHESGSSASEKNAQAASKQQAADEDAWTRRLRYLAEHGTASLKEGEAFMYSEETGEAVLFVEKGLSIRRRIAEPQDPEEVVRARRPDILAPTELQYNLSLLGKLMPRQSDEPTSQQAPSGDPLANFNIPDVLRNSNRFWDWLKQSVKF